MISKFQKLLKDLARAFPLSAFCRGRDHKRGKRDSRKSGLRPQSEQPQRLSLLAVHRFKFRGKWNHSPLWETLEHWSFLQGLQKLSQAQPGMSFLILWCQDSPYSCGFTRYMMLSLESLESNDIRSLGELFVYISDEMADITWLQALQMLLFRGTLSETAELTEEKINELVDNFLDTLPSLLKSLLCAA